MHVVGVNPKIVAKYLNDALETGDAVLVTKAIGDMTRADPGNEPRKDSSL